LSEARNKVASLQQGSAACERRGEDDGKELSKLRKANSEFQRHREALQGQVEALTRDLAQVKSSSGTFGGPGRRLATGAEDPVHPLQGALKTGWSAAGEAGAARKSSV
jgi:hypothetical protein